MKNISILVSFVLTITCACSQVEKTEIKDSSMKYNPLTEQQRAVILEKETDRPFTGEYYTKTDRGLYICRQCNNPLYRSDDKFEAHCGWPSFDDEIEGSVQKIADADGQRTEIICMNCQGHLGHVFTGEGFTDTDTRHCVNTSSILFVTAQNLDSLPEVIR